MRLVFCDDNRLLSEALATAMEALGHEVVAITTTASDGLAAVGAYQPDAVLLDLRVPAEAGRDGADATEGLIAAEAMRNDHPDTAVLVLSSLADRPTWAAAMRIGMAGFLGKDQDVDQIAAALDEVGAGRVVLRSHGAQPGDRPFPPSAAPLAAARAHPPGEGGPAPHRRGTSTGQMAEEMDIAINTLRSYVKNVLTKLGAHSRLQAAALAAREDLLGELSA